MHTFCPLFPYLISLCFEAGCVSHIRDCIPKPQPTPTIIMVLALLSSVSQSGPVLTETLPPTVLVRSKREKCVRQPVIAANCRSIRGVASQSVRPIQSGPNGPLLRPVVLLLLFILYVFFLISIFLNVLCSSSFALVRLSRRSTTTMTDGNGKTAFSTLFSGNSHAQR